MPVGSTYKNPLRSQSLRIRTNSEHCREASAPAPQFICVPLPPNPLNQKDLPMPSPDLPAPSAAPLAPGLTGFGRPQAIPGEDTAGYEALLARTSETVRPRDVIEEGFVRDVADLQWDILRNRRLKSALMRACAGEGLLWLLNSLD